MKTKPIGNLAASREILHVLLVEDNPGDADLLRESLSQVNGRVEIIHVDTLVRAVHHLKQASAIDAVLLDLGLPDSNGLGTLTKADFAAPHLPILVLTGIEDESLAIESVRHGAQDYLVKGQIKPNMLLRSIYHAIERKQAELVIAKLNQDLQRRIEEMQTIFETAPIGLAITEEPGASHIRGNPAIERMLGVREGGELSKGGPTPAAFRCLKEGREMAVEELPIQRAVRGESVTGEVLDILRDCSTKRASRAGRSAPFSTSLPSNGPKSGRNCSRTSLPGYWPAIGRRKSSNRFAARP
jgi:DNA-binding NarL/FixJ family response regulator